MKFHLGRHWFVEVVIVIVVVVAVVLKKEGQLRWWAIRQKARQEGIA